VDLSLLAAPNSGAAPGFSLERTADLPHTLSPTFSCRIIGSGYFTVEHTRCAFFGNGVAAGAGSFDALLFAREPPTTGVVGPSGIRDPPEESNCVPPAAPGGRRCTAFAGGR
jgi:hypothetical protein